jgi:hypothetical protein
MRRSRPPAVKQIHGFIAPFFRHVVVIHRGVDKRLESLLAAGACEVAGGALFRHGFYNHPSGKMHMLKC